MNTDLYSDTVQPRAASQFERAHDVLIGDQDCVLDDVGAPGIAAAIWRRQLDGALSFWLNSLPMEHLPELRETLPIKRVSAAVRAACLAFETPVGPEQDLLCADAAALARVFGRVMGGAKVKIRLDVCDEVMCPRFHLDNVAARLLCTYRGRGTEYVREGLQEASDEIRCLQTGAVGLFRGAAWPSAKRPALLHRSPSVSPGEGPRLLLVLDAA